MYNLDHLYARELADLAGSHVAFSMFGSHFQQMFPFDSHLLLPLRQQPCP